MLVNIQWGLLYLLQEGGLNGLKGPSKRNIYDLVSGGFQATNEKG